MNIWKTSSSLSFLALIAVVLVGSAGCSSTKYQKNPAGTSDQSEAIILVEGDAVKIAFPSAPNLDTTVKIRRDGKITLPEIGEIQAAGMTAEELQKDLKTRYADKLVSNEINVTIESSAFTVYVTGAVVRPGKLVSDKPMTALDALMESGGPDFTRANLKGVIISRKGKNGRIEHYKVDLKCVIKGTCGDSFDLRPSDIMYVPERFSMF
jgi:polysaccharide biosynthesis/export protein